MFLPFHPPAQHIAGKQNEPSPNSGREGSWYHPCSRAATCYDAEADSPQSRDNGRIPCAARIRWESFTALARRSLRAGVSPREALSKWLPISCGAFPPTPPGHRQLQIHSSVYAKSVWLAIIRPTNTYVSDASLPARPSPLPPRSPGDWRAPWGCVRAASREAAPTDSHRSRGGR